MVIIFFAPLINGCTTTNKDLISQPEIKNDIQCNITKEIHIETSIDGKNILANNNYKLEFKLFYSPYDRQNIDINCVKNIQILSNNIANYDFKNHEIKIAQNAKDGEKFTLTYEINSIKYVREYKIIDTSLYPLMGIWHEIPNPNCQAFLPNEQLIKELDINSKNVFAITWQPFESYHDYWGNFDFDIKTGNFKIEITRGNYIPDDIIKIGSAEILPNGNLKINDVFFGNNKNGQTRGNKCGHLFSK